MDILDSKFIKLYKDDMIKSIMRMNSEWRIDDIERELDAMILEQFQNPMVTLDNNYTEEQRDTTLLSVFDWVIERKPLIAGNATFYKNQYEAQNPIAEMLDNFLITRKKYKKKMFSVENTESKEYKDYDRKQGNEKQNANSYYGASGAPSSAFYSLWSGPATTYSAQSVISSAMNFFEAFLADNYAFIDSSELIHWMNQIIDKPTKVDDYIIPRSKDETFKRLYDKIIDKKDGDKELLKGYVNSLTDDEATLLYYKNNLIEFIDSHKMIQNVFLTIMRTTKTLEKIDEENQTCLNSIDTNGMSIKEWNKCVEIEGFMNPNNPPDSIKSELEILKTEIMKYVYVEYLSFDRIYRLRNFKRRVVTVIDTDSNILSLDILCEWLLDHVIKGDDFGRDKDRNAFIIVNTITYVITEAIKRIMLFYGENSNIPEEYRPRYSMKNEFFMPLLIIGLTKKRYISKIVLREGNLLNPPKNDVKGFDFKKATCSEYAEKRFMSIIKKYIVKPEEIQLREINRELMEFEKEIKESILSGDRMFLPNGSAKELQAYKDPASEQSIRGALAWNILNPDNGIEFPSKVSLVKMNIFTEEDMEPLKESNPEVYETILDKIFHDESGIFVTKKYISDEVTYINPNQQDWLKLVPKKYKAKFKNKTIQDWNEFVDSYDFDSPGNNVKGHYEIKSRGLQVLAIPSNGRIPDWAIPYIDINTMINDIISPFKSVLKLFNGRFVKEGRSHGGVNRKTEKLSNIIKF